MSKRAWRTTCCGITSIVSACSPAQAKARTMRSALEVYDRRQVKFTDITARRAPEHDEWAEVDETGHCWEERYLPQPTRT